jgi:hypothetical protein
MQDNGHGYNAIKDTLILLDNVKLLGEIIDAINKWTEPRLGINGIIGVRK